MGNPIIVGDDSPQFQFWEQRWKPWAGGESSDTWLGYNLAKMSTLAQGYVHAGYGGSLKFAQNMATLVINTTDLSGGGNGSGGRALIDKWEVAVDQEKPELFENSAFLSIVQANDNTGTTGYNLQSKQIIQKIKSGAEGGSATAWSDFYTAMQSPIIGPDGITALAGTHLSDGINFLGSFPNLKNFVDDYFRGATSFVHGKYSLKHTTVAPGTYSTNVADFNVEQIYSIAALLSEAQDPTLWILPLPAYLAFKISAYPVPSAMPPNFEFGSLKMRASATTMARGKIEIVTEYLIDAWPIHTYGLGPQ